MERIDTSQQAYLAISDSIEIMLNAMDNHKTNYNVLRDVFHKLLVIRKKQNDNVIQAIRNL